MTTTITSPVMLDIIRAISAAMADGFEVFGIRNDAVRLPSGTECRPSHQLYQDAELLDPWDADYCDDPDAENLRYPWNDELQAYDAGELPGTCAIGIQDPERLECLREAVAAVYPYPGDYWHVIGSRRGAIGGNDPGEWILEDAVVICGGVY